MTLSKHAKIRSAQRNITKEEINICILNGNRMQIQNKVKIIDKCIVIIIDNELVVTVHYQSKFNKLINKYQSKFNISYTEATDLCKYLIS